jgi:hypothetical protein
VKCEAVETIGQTWDDVKANYKITTFVLLYSPTLFTITVGFRGNSTLQID